MGYGGALPANPAALYLQSAAVGIPTYDGSGQCTEPAVRFFPQGWNGWKYWMAMNPLPSGNAAFENGSIVVSNDGVSWQVPAGLTNPIFPAPAAGNNGDVHMAMSADGLTAYLVSFGPTNPTTGVGVTIFVKSSTDGITWTPSGQGQAIGTVGGSIVEPKLLWDGTQWRLYYCDYVGPAGANLFYKTNSDPMGAAGTWSAPTTCAYTIPSATNVLFHFDIIRERNGRYVAAMYVNNTGGGIWMASSWDGINWAVASRMLLDNGQSVQAWCPSFYRPSIALLGVGHYGLWHGTVQGSTWKIGRISIPASEIP